MFQLNDTRAFFHVYCSEISGCGALPFWMFVVDFEYIAFRMYVCTIYVHNRVSRHDDGLFFFFSLKREWIHISYIRNNHAMPQRNKSLENGSVNISYALNILFIQLFDHCWRSDTFLRSQLLKRYKNWWNFGKKHWKCDGNCRKFHYK